MAKARALDKRRKAIRNVRKITRTMELIATARFKKAMDRAHAATAYTRRITALVAELASAGLQVSHPLLAGRTQQSSATLLVLTGNRGLCGGYNSNVVRLAIARHKELAEKIPRLVSEISGKRGITACNFRGLAAERTYTNFDDKPSFAEVEVLADRFLAEYAAGRLDRLDVAYTRFENVARQSAVVETLLPMGAISTGESTERRGESQYEFLPSAQSILNEIVPTSFKVRLFKCFLDAAVSEQIARMVAMKAATENSDKLIKKLSMTYNRARQSQITNEIMEVLGGVEALKKK